ncbi:MAG: hypothetical protein WA441_01370 [Methyloceanibacter sp.]
MTNDTNTTKDDELLTLWDEWKVSLEAELAATDDAESDRRHKRVSRLHEAIRATPARDLEGVAIKLALALWYYGDDVDDIITEQLRAAYVDASRITGRDYLAEINAILEQWAA